MYLFPVPISVANSLHWEFKKNLIGPHELWSVNHFPPAEHA